MGRLVDLGVKYGVPNVDGGTDKGTWHSYLGFYEGELARFVGVGACLLELGVAGGFSLLLWRDFLEDGVVHGVDWCEMPGVIRDEEGIVFHRGDLGDRVWLEGEFGALGFDVVVDDASHELAQMESNFEMFFPLVREGGLYVVEDVMPEFVTGLVLLRERRVEVVDLRCERPGRGIPDNILVVYRKF